MAAAETPIARIPLKTKGVADSRGLLLKHAANEFIFAVVGHVGSGTSEIADALRDALQDPSLPGGAFVVQTLKASDTITEWARKNGEVIPEKGKGIERTVKLQDVGDKMRAVLTVDGQPDHSAVARQLIRGVRNARATLQGKGAVGDEPILPDGVRRAYVLDSLRHPAEVHLLRHLYQDAFVLIGVACEENKRIERLLEKFPDAGKARIKGFMKRDADALEKHGQKVADTFHLSDFFVDNTTDRELAHEVANPLWDTPEKLGRLVKILTHSKIERPEVPEIAMHHAHGAMMQSACLSRQVGAALVDSKGNVVATGTNEVPKAGGGVYGEFFGDPGDVKGGAQDLGAAILDDRCAYREPDARKICSNTQEQNRIIGELINDVPELEKLDEERKKSLALELRKTRIGSLLEFSRAVHAEMDALLSAARQGISPLATRMYVTTQPCHYCARHLVTAGIDEVQYIEPYPKSQALELHDDAIQIVARDWVPPSSGGRKVLFRPFSGVAPRLFSRAFLKVRDLKDKNTGLIKISEPDWGTPWHLRTASYVELEAVLAKVDNE